MRPWAISLAATVVISLLLPSAGSAATLVPLAPSSAWDSTPIHGSSPPGDPRLFVVERGGGVRIVEDGVLQTRPFLTVPNVDTFNERGLLSIAFAPDYATSGLFYVFTVAAGPDALDSSGETGDLRIVEYRRSAADPDLADPSSARLVLKLAHGGVANHNGGQLAFGPEGLLYVTIGDAAVSANAQDLSNDLGKLLRIDPNPPSGVGFGIPPSNPFLGTVGARPEIYALGLRNPFRASFGPSGELVLPDVGQTTWEEVNVGRPTGTAAATTLAGANLGWPTCEAACPSPNPSFVDPIFQYGHGPGATEATGCAIVGGYIVRDPALTGLTGRYLYGDFCRNDLRTLDLDAPGADPRPAGVSIPTSDGGPLGFGEDASGCLYVMTAVTVYRLAESAAAGTACAPPSASDAGRGPSSGPGDTIRPRLSLSAARRQRLRRFVTVFASCDEACALRAGGTLGLSAATASRSLPLIAATGSGQAGQRLRLRLKLRRKALMQAKWARRHGAKVRVRARVRATDPSGNTVTRVVRVLLR
ncbi:MAG: PQQ-dependent sugar dehydrogenase [Solirubrobacterales bacterium]